MFFAFRFASYLLTEHSSKSIFPLFYRLAPLSYFSEYYILVLPVQVLIS